MPLYIFFAKYKKEAVMEQNRIQFQKGYCIIEFMRYYGTEEQCRQTLESARWPKGLA